jgi:hypothetical protein
MSTLHANFKKTLQKVTSMAGHKHFQRTLPDNHFVAFRQLPFSYITIQAIENH